MTRFRSALREAIAITAGAAVLGFASTAIRNTGVFASGSPPKPLSLRTDSPTMIHLPEAKELFGSGTALFIDARHTFEFDRGHIPGAINLPLNEFDSRAGMVDSLPRNRILITYCDGVECNSSIGLAARLRDAGFFGVRIFFAGWSEWRAQNLPTEATAR